MKKFKIHPLLIALIWVFVSGIIASFHLHHDCIWGWLMWTSIPGILYGIIYDLENG